MTAEDPLGLDDGDTAVKGFFDGTHRLISPERTLERMRPLMSVMGITRLAVVTGLDTSDAGRDVGAAELAIAGGVAGERADARGRHGLGADGSDRGLSRGTCQLAAAPGHLPRDARPSTRRDPIRLPLAVDHSFRRARRFCGWPGSTGRGESGLRAIRAGAHRLHLTHALGSQRLFARTRATDLASGNHCSKR